MVSEFCGMLGMKLVFYMFLEMGGLFYRGGRGVFEKFLVGCWEDYGSVW